jgi:hypothetical protein
VRNHGAIDAAIVRRRAGSPMPRGTQLHSYSRNDNAMTLGLQLTKARNSSLANGSVSCVQEPRLGEPGEVNMLGIISSGIWEQLSKPIAKTLGFGTTVAALLAVDGVPAFWTRGL